MVQSAYDPVAQLDRANGFEPLGWGFKSLRGRHLNPRRLSQILGPLYHKASCLARELFF